MSEFYLPAGLRCVRRVSSFEELVGTRFSGEVNALCWQRDLKGDYAEIVRLVERQDGIRTLDEELLQALPVSEAGRAAVEQLVADLGLLRERGLQPSLDCIRGYPRDEDYEVVRTDVFSFHADSATVEADTYLCTYYGAPSEGLPNEAVRRHVDIPETRAELLKLYGGADDAGFREFLADHCFDLHYEPKPGAQPFGFGVGNLWRIAIACPDSPVQPCVHRAPQTVVGVPRLLLIS